MSEFDSLFSAIAGQESGGNYGAVNARTGASGKFQIMPANIGPWSQKYLGHTVSVAQFRSSPQIQEQLARAVLQDYYNKYGLRGAAATWYSGNPASASNYKRFRSNEPSVGEYVDSVIRRMGSNPGTADLQAAAAGTVQTVKRDNTSSISSPTTMLDEAGKPITISQLGLAGVGNGLELGLDAADGANALGQVGKAAQTQNLRIRMPATNQGGTTSTTGAASMAGGATGNALRQAAVSKALALSQQGIPYVWGGTSTRGFDCSGLTGYVLNGVGIKVPRVSDAQSNVGPHISLANAKPGDLIGFSGGGHIAIYVGNGMMVEAPRPGLTVRETPVRGAYAVDMSGFYHG